MAGLPGIVTLHDFTIKAPGTNTNQLQMNITAKPIATGRDWQMVPDVAGSRLNKCLVLLAAVLLAGCSGNDMSDLDAFMAEKRARPGV